MSISETVKRFKEKRKKRIDDLFNKWVERWSQLLCAQDGTPTWTRDAFEAGYRAGRIDEQRETEEREHPGDHVEGDLY